MEIWIEVETRPDVYSFPEEETYGADFVVDTPNMAYPGCTSVYLGDAGHVVTFYGCRGAVRAGLTLEQSAVATQALSEIPTWMGAVAKYTVRPISLTEASELLCRLKRLKEEELRWAKQELAN